MSLLQQKIHSTSSIHQLQSLNVENSDYSFSSIAFASYRSFRINQFFYVRKRCYSYCCWQSNQQRTLTEGSRASASAPQIVYVPTKLNHLYRKYLMTGATATQQLQCKPVRCMHVM